MSGKLTSPRVETATILLLNGHTTKLPSEYTSLCSLISTSDHLREVSLCSGPPLMQELIAGQMQRVSINGALSHIWDRSTTASPGIRRMEEEEQKDWTRQQHSGRDGSTLLTNAQQLWLAAHDLYKVESVTTPSWTREGLMSPQPS